MVKNEMVKSEMVKNEKVKNENGMVTNEMVKNEMVKNEMVKNVNIFCNITQSLLMLRFVDITIFRGAGHQQRLHDKLTRRHGNLNVD